MAIVAVTYLFATYRGNHDLEDVIMFILMVGYPSLVLFYAITTKPPSDESKKVTYLDLFFERRRLEEKAKINKLKSDAK
jgi:hypothetical protein